MKVDPKDYGTGAIGPEDLEGTAAILTVETFDEIVIQEEAGERKAPLLRFAETGDKPLWLNPGMVASLVAQLGGESDDWKGARVPVEVYTPRYRGKGHGDKVRVVPAEEWATAFRQAGEPFKSRVKPAPAAPAPATRSAKSAKRTGGKRR